jgi:phage gpG-like protein
MTTRSHCRTKATTWCLSQSKMATENKFHTERMLAALKACKQDLPTLLAKDARSHFLNSWKQQGWDGKPWKEVQRRIPGTKAYKYPKKTQLSRRKNPILVGTYKGRSGGRLRRSINESIREATWETIRLGTDVPYAAYINEGTDHMEARKFMGQSTQLSTKMKNRIRKELGKIFHK